MSCYRYFQESPCVLRLDDGNMSSFYLVKGEKSALLVDTGMGKEPLLDYVRTLTELPITVVITHGHGDHVMHAGGFDTVYMSAEDVPYLSGACARLGIQEPIDASRFLPLKDGQRLEVGEFTLHCVNVGGHSPGSVVLYEEKHHLLFTGDAVGSGVGVWLQLTGCLPLSRYRENLKRLSDFWATLPEDTQVFTGHWEQRFMHPDGDNPVCRALVEDMVALCDDILQGKEDRREAPEMMAREYRPVYTASHGRASMVYCERVIK